MKVICPYHQDVNPSCEVYEENGFCFVCNKVVPLSELGLSKNQTPKEKYVEDIQAKRKYIENLPIRHIRGLPLHYDSTGYYILWSDSPYYKLRLHKDVKGPRYKNPSGHEKPLFWAARGHSTDLFIVEGEINAMSLTLAFPARDVCSPGSAGDMYRKKQERYLTEYCKYSSIIIVVDRDGPGVTAAIRLKLALLSRVPFINVVLMEKDCNEILTNGGTEALRQEMQNAMRSGL